MAARNLHVSDDFVLPREAVTQTFVIYGARGTGKTTFGAVLCEELSAAGLRFSYLDPMGHLWGLRHGKDGRGRGIEVLILGGKHGDLPIEPSAGAVVADLVADENVSVIIDISRRMNGTMWSKREKIRFVTDYMKRLFERQGEQSRPLMQILDEAARYCLSEDTELLTRTGWRRYEDIRVGGDAVCFDLKTETYSYGPVQRMIVRDFDGEMVRLKTNAMDCLATPEHRVVLRRVQRAQGRYGLYPWTFRPAAYVPTCVGVPSGGAPIGAGLSDLTLEQARVLGWLITDGNIHDVRQANRKFVLEQSVATVKAGISMSGLMDAVLAPLPGVTRYVRGPRKTESGGRIRSPASSIRWYFGGDSSEKFSRLLGTEPHRVPRRLIENGSREQLQALFDGLLEGDGTTDDGAWSKFYPGNDEGLADDFQEIALRLGVSTTKTWVPSQGEWHVSLAGRDAHWLRRPERVFYTGKVWDITVPTGAFVARRNGRVFVTGNCPQIAAHGDAQIAECIGAIEQVVEEGRGIGLGMTLITQRSARLAKSVAELAECMIAFRTVGPNSVSAIVDWFGEHIPKERWKGLVEELRKLKRGTALVVSPGWLDFEGTAAIRDRKTFDSSATPRAGERARSARDAGAVIDLAAYRERMKATIEKAIAEDPRRWKALLDEKDRKVKELERALGAVKPAAAPEAKPLEVPVLDKKVLARAEKLVERAYGESSPLTKSVAVLSELRGMIEQAVGLVSAHRGLGPPDLRIPAKVRERFEPQRAIVRTPAGRGPRPLLDGGEPPLKAGERRILDVVARSYPARRTAAQIGTLARFTPSGGTFQNYMSRLRRFGFIAEEGTLVTVTAAGMKELGFTEPPPPLTREAVVDDWRKALKDGERCMLDVLLERGEGGISRAELAEEAGRRTRRGEPFEATGGTYNNYLSVLRRNGLATVVGDTVKLGMALEAV